MFKKGTHICVDRVGYVHHGIYIGGACVVHYGGDSGDDGKETIEVVGLYEFERDGQAYEYPKENEKLLKGKRFSREEIVKRALSRVGEDDYDLFDNNCEHFATWCTHGDSMSTQSDGYVSQMYRLSNGMPLNTGIDATPIFRAVYKVNKEMKRKNFNRGALAAFAPGVNIFDID